MADKAGRTCVFRPRGKFRERFDYAYRLGVNVSSVLNTVVEKHGGSELEKAIREKEDELRKVLSVAR